MGRVSRYKRIAKDDPFAPKRSQKVDETIDFEPTKKTMKDDGGGMTRSMRAFMKAQERMKKSEERTKHRNSTRAAANGFRSLTVRRFNELSEKAKARLHNKPKTEFVSEAQRSASLEFMPDTKKPVAAPKLAEMQEDETYRDFSKRIREETAGMLRKRVVADSHKTEKRREYYEKKREQKRKKREGIQSDDEKDEEEGKIGDFSKLPSDRVQFGEVVQRPPIFKTLPKNSSKVDMQIAKRVASSGTSGPLTAFKEKKKAATMARLADFDRSALTSVHGAPTTVVRKTVDTPEEKAAMEVLRQRVQEQYRAMKAAKLAARATKADTPSEYKRKKKTPGFTFSKEDLEKFQEMRPESKRGLKKAKKENEWLRR